MSTNQPYEEKYLLAQIAEGNEEAFAGLYRIYYPQLQPLIAKSALAGVDADDILQSAFLNIWLHRHELPDIKDPKPWIFKVAYREYLMAVRKKMRYNGKLDGYTNSVAAGHTTSSPLQTASYHEVRRHIQAIVDALPAQRKLIYQMSRERGMKAAEIAQELSISVHTVKSVLQTVLKILRERLKAAGYDPLIVLAALNFFFFE